ncbi:helix-turn-helix domain-containing protein [Paenibacillus oleatilyticus]|uniref:helix-turn-helix domain-containing protein n=1 Tax=Paenibacillus oleatilyticus TaxID=2594886 RepID=UPI001C1F2451|nr:S24 family peptidase [Paenibacillus oleatilyticus]MBU7316073.1 helix-turn-helix domain-containing protein [Paenibacillus oleatilyticus]
MKPSAKDFGGYLKMLRQRCGMTVRELEDKSGVSHSYLTQMENGRRGVPSPDILKKLFEPLNTSYDDLMAAAGYLEPRVDNVYSELKNDSSMFLDMKGQYNVANKTLDLLQRNNESLLEDEVVQIPIYGEIKAGYNMIAEQNIIGYKVASKKEVSDGEYFYLIVKGDSMIDEGIREGYKVLVKRQSFVENGKIGVVIVNGDEATLKRVFYDGSNVILQASNKEIPPRVLSIGDVMIQGQVRSVVFDV